MSAMIIYTLVYVYTLTYNTIYRSAVSLFTFQFHKFSYFIRFNYDSLHKYLSCVCSIYMLSINPTNCSRTDRTVKPWGVIYSHLNTFK